MFEIAVLVSIFTVFAICAFFPLLRSMPSLNNIKGIAPMAANKSNLPERSSFSHQVLGQVRNEIESTLFPRPTDSILQRHYDTLVAVKLENRLTNIING